MVKPEISVISDKDELKNMFATKGGNKEKDLKANTILEKWDLKIMNYSNKNMIICCVH